MGIREAVNQKPWMGWVVAGALLVVAAIAVWRSTHASSTEYSVERATQEIVIKDRETGEEWKIPRGRMEVMLMERVDLDPNVGLPNPKTGKLTGFPKSDWEATVERIKADQTNFAEAYGGHVPSGGGSKAPARAVKAPK